MPTNITTTPIRNNQPNVGKNNTSNMPTPNPIKHTPNVFFKIFIMIPPSFLIYYMFTSNLFVKFVLCRNFTYLVCISHITQKKRPRISTSSLYHIFIFKIYYPFTKSFNALPALNTGALDAGIFISSFV